MTLAVPVRPAIRQALIETAKAAVPSTKIFVLLLDAAGQYQFARSIEKVKTALSNVSLYYYWFACLENVGGGWKTVSKQSQDSDPTSTHLARLCFSNHLANFGVLSATFASSALPFIDLSQVGDSITQWKSIFLQISSLFGMCIGAYRLQELCRFRKALQQECTFDDLKSFLNVEKDSQGLNQSQTQKLKRLSGKKSVETFEQFLRQNSVKDQEKEELIELIKTQNTKKILFFTATFCVSFLTLTHTFVMLAVLLQVAIAATHFAVDKYENWNETTASGWLTLESTAKGLQLWDLYDSCLNVSPTSSPTSDLPKA